MIRPVRLALLPLLALLPATMAWAETIVVQPGSRTSLHLQGKSNVTYRCASPGACSLSPGSKISNSSNIVVDGFRVEGGTIGLTIAGSSNVVVTNSTFVEQHNSGIVVNPGQMSHNITIANNSFVNHSLGCNYLDPSNCSGHLGDGSVVANMDYGVRIYATDGVVIRDNSFASVFNHAVSLKSTTDNAQILNNQFNGCGRVCIQLAQESSIGSVYIDGNVLRGNARWGISTIHQARVTLGHNTIDITGDWSNGGGTVVDGGPPPPPYVYVPPVIEDPVHRRDRVIGEGPKPHNCCDDPNNPIDPSVMARLMRLQAAGPP